MIYNNPIKKYAPYNYTSYKDIRYSVKKVPLRTIFLANTGGYSSKRICGVIGWVIAMFCFVWCVITGNGAPDFATELIIGCVSLLGVDSVSNAIRGRFG